MSELEPSTPLMAKESERLQPEIVPIFVYVRCVHIPFSPSRPDKVTLKLEPLTTVAERELETTRLSFKLRRNMVTPEVRKTGKSLSLPLGDLCGYSFS